MRMQDLKNTGDSYNFLSFYSVILKLGTKKELKKVLKYVYPIKRYDVLKCEFLLFFVTKWRKIHISELDIFWLDRDISDFFSVLRSLWQVLSNGNIRYPMLESQILAHNSWRHFPAKNAQIKKHRILENDEFFFGA